MKRLLTRIMVALLAFTIGVFADFAVSTLMSEDVDLQVVSPVIPTPPQMPECDPPPGTVCE